MMGSCTKDIASFSKIQLPMMRKVYPKMIADNLVGVQPMTGAGAGEPVPAPREFVQVLRAWIAETFGIAVADTKRVLTLRLVNSDTSLTINCLESHISIRSMTFYWEDPNLFDQLEKVITLWIEGKGYDKLDCFLATLMAATEGRIKPEQDHQPASLIFYLRYRYASTKKNNAKA